MCLFVFGFEYFDGKFGWIGVGGDVVLVEIFGGFFDFDVVGEWGDYWFDEVFGFYFFFYFDYVVGEYYWWGDDGVLIVED